MPENHEEIEKIILKLVRKRGPGKTICPSDAARVLSIEEVEWRSLMPEVRKVAAYLAKRGEIVATQKGVEVDIAEVKGPIRLGLRL